MKFELIARKGHEPVAVLAHGIDLTDYDAIFAVGDLARRILGDRAAYSGALSGRWRQCVFGTPEFLAWWRAQDHGQSPAAEDRILLEVLHA